MAARIGDAHPLDELPQPIGPVRGVVAVLDKDGGEKTGRGGEVAAVDRVLVERQHGPLVGFKIHHCDMPSGWIDPVAAKGRLPP